MESGVGWGYVHSDSRGRARSSALRGRVLYANPRAPTAHLHRLCTFTSTPGGGACTSVASADRRPTFHDARPGAQEAERPADVITDQKRHEPSDESPDRIVSDVRQGFVNAEGSGNDGAGPEIAPEQAAASSTSEVVAAASQDTETDTFIVYHTRSGPAKLQRVITISDIKSVSQPPQDPEVRLPPITPHVSPGPLTRYVLRVHSRSAR